MHTCLQNKYILPQTYMNSFYLKKKKINLLELFYDAFVWQKDFIDKKILIITDLICIFNLKVPSEN